MQGNEACLEAATVLPWLEVLVFRLTVLMLFAAGTRSPGHCSHDGETGRYDRRNRPRCASGVYPRTDTKAGVLFSRVQSNTKCAAVLYKYKV